MWQALQHWEMEDELIQMVKMSPTIITEEPVPEGVSDFMRYKITTSIKLYLSPAEFAELINKGAS
jgi:hypothetical protein